MPKNACIEMTETFEKDEISIDGIKYKYIKGQWERINEAIDHKTDGALIIDKIINSLQIFKQRNAEYGSNWWASGRMLKAMFPKGITLTSEEDFVRFSILLQQVSKFTRYANSFFKGGHDDSSVDLGVYSFIMAGVDDYINNFTPKEE